MDNRSTEEGMSLVVKTVARWLKAFILLFGAYIVIYGHLTPGGGFAGGVIAACAFVLLLLAEGKRVCSKTAGKDVASVLDSVGALMFLAVGLAGMYVGGIFFKNVIATPAAAHFNLLSGGLIPVSNIAIGIKVAMSLFLVLLALSAFRVTVRKGEEKVGASE